MDNLFTCIHVYIYVRVSVSAVWGLVWKVSACVVRHEKVENMHGSRREKTNKRKTKTKPTGMCLLPAPPFRRQGVKWNWHTIEHKHHHIAHISRPPPFLIITLFSPPGSVLSDLPVLCFSVFRIHFSVELSFGLLVCRRFFLSGRAVCYIIL